MNKNGIEEIEKVINEEDVHYNETLAMVVQPNGKLKTMLVESNIEFEEISAK